MFAVLIPLVVITMVKLITGLFACFKLKANIFYYYFSLIFMPTMIKLVLSVQTNIPFLGYFWFSFDHIRGIYVIFLVVITNNTCYQVLIINIDYY